METNLFIAYIGIAIMLALSGIDRDCMGLPDILCSKTFLKFSHPKSRFSRRWLRLRLG